MRNRINNNRKSLWFGIVLLTLTACNDWLDVDPKSQVKDKDLFSSEMGFKEALSGVYSIMTQEYLYGKEMTFGMLGVLGQEWDSQPTDYTDDLNYKYENTRPEVRIDSLWCGLYNAIANTNKLLEEIEGKESMFTGINYDMIKGEALALRGFLHFDLLRLFGASYAENPKKAAIPYVMAYTSNIYPQDSVGGVITKVLGDLTASLDYLKNDHIRPDTTAPGLKEAREKLIYYSMDASERAAYDRHVDAIMIQNDVLGTAKFEGLVEGRAEGRAEGREEGKVEGRVEGRAEGLVEGKLKGIVEVARNLKKLGVPLDSIIRSTGLTNEEIEQL